MGLGIGVGFSGTGVGAIGVAGRVSAEVDVGETSVPAGAHETKIRAASKTARKFLIFMNTSLYADPPRMVPRPTSSSAVTTGGPDQPALIIARNLAGWPSSGGRLPCLSSFFCGPLCAV